MTFFKSFISMLALLALAACGGGNGTSNGSQPFGGTGSGGGTGGSGGSGGTATAALTVALSNSTVSSAAPVTVTATAANASGVPLSGLVVSFKTSGGLGTFSSTTALTNASGVATVTLSPSTSSVAGADTVVATTTAGTTAITGSAGFSLVASTASITSFSTAAGASATSPLSAYGQTVLTVDLSGATSATPVTLSIASACVAAGKAKISPATLTATSSTATFTYQDTGGCGSTLLADTLTASISGTTSQQALQLYLSSPTANNIVFVSATPPTIYLQGTGLTTSSQVIFQVNDAANNPLPGQVVTMSLNTFAGGLTINSGQVPVTQTTDSNGQVSVLVNSGSVPTPVRVTASLGSGATAITTVSSNLSVAVGLPSELHFSLAQGTINVEGYNVQGSANSYTVIASDRLGNPVPNGTAINFVAEGGQVQAAAFTATIANAGVPCPAATAASSASGSGLSCAVAQFQTSKPVPPDGRVTVMAYALGEKSFVDTNGNNVYDTGEQFQDLGNPYLDTLYNGQYGSSPNNQYVVQSPAGSSACNSTAPSTLPSSLQLDVSIPSMPGTCTGNWGKAYVRRAVETIFSTSAAQPVWGTAWPSGSATPASACPSLSLIQPNLPPASPAYDALGHPQTQTYYPFGGAGLYVGAANTTGIISFLVADANPYALNPVAAGSTITVTGTTGLTATLVGGSPVPSTSTPSGASVSYSFSSGVTSGTLTVTIKSPGGVATTVSQFIQAADPPSGYHTCP